MITLYLTQFGDINLPYISKMKPPQPLLHIKKAYLSISIPLHDIIIKLKICIPHQKLKSFSNMTVSN